MKMFLNIVKQYWILLSLGILVSITVLSLSPMDHLPPVPGTDKTHHFVAYAALMFPVAFRKPKHWLWIGLFFIAYSGMIELIQPYVNRYGEWLDLAANTGGILSGVVLAFISNFFLLKMKADSNLY